ncbi:hypothetical protein CPSG_07694 [Coccidioides posadasii str. Silveira]|uniref:Uncharacterized protein n=1 Tax=Coccidioides posadasii (strain RMSCC 757 / Silveira) TaxID=443226 RepID=E9DDQ1_COCPS|nr:hypothetical protein CPSG_07694 [Coccidioides posadasii str. Silveira]
MTASISKDRNNLRFLVARISSPKRPATLLCLDFPEIASLLNISAPAEALVFMLSCFLNPHPPKEKRKKERKKGRKKRSSSSCGSLYFWPVCHAPEKRLPCFLFRNSSRGEPQLLLAHEQNGQKRTTVIALLTRFILSLVVVAAYTRGFSYAANLQSCSICIGQ